MDADIVKEVEFSRKMRGYDMGEVDAFLEKIEAMLRRRDLENENLQHRLEELDGAREAQSEKLSILNGQVLLAQEENQRLTAKIEELQKELEEKEAWIETLEGSLTNTRTNLAAARSETLGGTLYLVGREAKTGELMGNATSCPMCRRLIINAGIQRVIIRRTPSEYSVVHVEDWVREDDSLPQHLKQREEN